MACEHDPACWSSHRPATGATPRRGLGLSSHSHECTHGKRALLAAMSAWLPSVARIAAAAARVADEFLFTTYNRAMFWLYANRTSATSKLEGNRSAFPASAAVRTLAAGSSAAHGLDAIAM